MKHFDSILLLLVAFGAWQSALPQEPAARPASGVCIAVMAAAVTGVDGNAAEAGAAARDLLVSFLTGPSMQPIALESRVRLQAVEEAKQKNCAHVVTLALSRKRSGGSGLGRALGQAAGTAAWYVPGGSGAAWIARGVTAGAARALGDLASTTRAKDEMRLDWTLTSSTKPATHTDKQKASSDGEDLLTPLVQRAAESIVETVLK
ncbi:MAG: hypothetical protein ABIS06_01430 [Vicinamibacterales bacterium]